MQPQYNLGDMVTHPCFEFSKRVVDIQAKDTYVLYALKGVSAWVNEKDLTLVQAFPAPLYKVGDWVYKTNAQIHEICQVTYITYDKDKECWIYGLNKNGYNSGKYLEPVPVEDRPPYSIGEKCVFSGWRCQVLDYPAKGYVCLTYGDDTLLVKISEVSAWEKTENGL